MEGQKRRRLKLTCMRQFESAGLSLRGRLENSNYIFLKIPIAIHLFQRGQQLICMDGERLPEILGVTEQDIEILSLSGLVRPQPHQPQPQ